MVSLQKYLLLQGIELFLPVCVLLLYLKEVPSDFVKLWILAEVIGVNCLGQFLEIDQLFWFGLLFEFLQLGELSWSNWLLCWSFCLKQYGFCTNGGLCDRGHSWLLRYFFRLNFLNSKIVDFWRPEIRLLNKSLVRLHGLGMRQRYKRLQSILRL